MNVSYLNSISSLAAGNPCNVCLKNQFSLWSLAFLLYAFSPLDRLYYKVYKVLHVQFDFLQHGTSWSSWWLAGVASTPVLRQEWRNAAKRQIGSQVQPFEKENKYGVMVTDKTWGDFKHWLRSCQAVSFLFHLESSRTNRKILYRPKSSDLS